MGAHRFTGYLILALAAIGLALPDEASSRGISSSNHPSYNTQIASRAVPGVALDPIGNVKRDPRARPVIQCLRTSTPLLRGY
jgi:hypothetical protein